MTNIERAAFVINETYADEYVKIHMTPLKVAQALADAGILAPAPQIIRTREELEALDHDTVLLLADMTKQDAYDTQQTAHRDEILGRDFSIGVLPAAVLTPGAQVRAARTALQEDTE